MLFGSHVLEFNKKESEGGKIMGKRVGKQHLLIKKNVYDVSQFLEDHLGGDEVLLSAPGKDAIDDFEDVGHSTSARAMMDEFYVGEIDTATLPVKTDYT